jgi:hypothetical protein
MTNRRLLIQSLIAGLAGFIPLRRLWAQEGVGLNAAERLTEQNIVALEDQLKNGLRATTPGQHMFIRLVVNSVNQGRLPRAMVLLIYEWALKRNPRVPFPYFQYALRVLARKRGVDLS